VSSRTWIRNSRRFSRDSEYSTRVVDVLVKEATTNDRSETSASDRRGQAPRKSPAKAGWVFRKNRRPWHSQSTATILAPSTALAMWSQSPALQTLGSRCRGRRPGGAPTSIAYLICLAVILHPWRASWREHHKPQDAGDVQWVKSWSLCAPNAHHTANLFACVWSGAFRPDGYIARSAKNRLLRQTGSMHWNIFSLKRIKKDGFELAERQPRWRSAGSMRPTKKKPTGEALRYGRG